MSSLRFRELKSEPHIDTVIFLRAIADAIGSAFTSNVDPEALSPFHGVVSSFWEEEARDLASELEVKVQQAEAAKDEKLERIKELEEELLAMKSDLGSARKKKS